MSNDAGDYVTQPDGARVWQAAPASEKPKRRSRATSGVKRSPFSDEERAERLRFEQERLEVRKRELAVLEKLMGPALQIDGDPRVQAERVIPLDARTTAGRELAQIARASGSTLRAHARTYDGAAGGPPKFYACLSVWFRGSGGGRFRSKGVAVEGPELRQVGEALLELADEFEAACAAGVEPWAVPGGSWKAPEPEPEPEPVASSDCPDCGGELPDGHLEGCEPVDNDAITAPASPRAIAAQAGAPTPLLPGAARKTVRIACDDGASAAKLTAELQRESLHATDAGGAIVYIPCAFEPQAEALEQRLLARGLRVERV